MIKPIETKKYSQLQNVTECIPGTQNNIKCVFSGSEVPGSESALKVKCLRPGVLIVEGNLEAIKIICSSRFPIDFEYDGVQPTEALLPLFSKTMSPNVSSIPKSSALEDYFPSEIYNVELIVFGYDYFHGLNNPFFSIKAEDYGSSHKSQMWNYTRSGRYMFREIHNKTVLYEFYMFVEDNESTPSFIRGKTTQAIVYNSSHDQLILPCRPSHHTANITLKKISEVSKSLDFSADPIKGVTLYLKSNNLNPQGTYVCELNYGNYSDELTFEYPNKVEDENLPYGFEDSPPMIPYKDLSLQVTYIFYVIQNVATVRPTCDATSLDSSSNPPNLVLLTNIPCRNPMHCRLVREFISPKFMNTSYSVEVGKLTDDLFSGLRLDSGLPFTYGLTMCQSTKHFKAMEYGVSLDGRATAVSYGFDWLKLPGRTKAEIKIYLNIGIENQTDTRLYAKRSETFRCKIFSSVLIKPVLWLIELKNGTLIFETLDSNFYGDTSYRSIMLDSNVQAVHCGASLYYKNFWRRIVMNVEIFDGSSPRVLIDQSQQNAAVKLGTQNHLLRCSAEGEPFPDMTWEKDGKILKTSLKSQSILLEISEVNTTTTGMYTCIAKNHLGSDSQSFSVGIEYDNPNYWLLVGLPATVFILTVVAFTAYIKFFRKEKPGLSREEIEAFLNGDRGGAGRTQDNDYVHEFSHTISYNTEFEVPAARFEVDQKSLLGSGAFGMVLKGKVYGRPVAVKTVNRFADKSYLQALLSELKIMIYIGKHDSIVELVGAFTSQLRRGNVYIFVELCTNGSMENYLRNNRHKFICRDKQSNYQNSESVRLQSKGYFDNLTLTKWSFDVACAMEYLSSKKVIHGDLAARNILLSEDMKVKVTDFGLSRQLRNYSHYVKKHQVPLPWRWMSLESLRDLTFSPQSDAWSFGVLIWEFFSLAEVPYPGYAWTQEFVGLLEDGLRMACPKYASNHFYQSVILECWRERPSERPTFATLTSRILEYLTTMKEDASNEDNENHLEDLSATEVNV
ncbi:Vascular endothelial growth factor receptor 2 [Orchesella cincta]|uniref:Vascular endothelial growth factor receptor 2 n=1 Tax=Orchesella cincta TaxID=48709 RepID=A0A1D2N265_ORCCI|nr:Vascular endothelial growth factor receptor 2 [Orchesella cincta]